MVDAKGMLMHLHLGALRVARHAFDFMNACRYESFVREITHKPLNLVYGMLI